MYEPTVGEISGFKAIDRSVKLYKDVSVKCEIVSTRDAIGYFPDSMLQGMGIVKPKDRKHIVLSYRPQACKKCHEPMTITTRKKANVNTGQKAVVGYTCNNVGCQDVKAKKFILEMKEKDKKLRDQYKSRKGIPVSSILS